MKRFCTSMVVSLLVWLSPELAASSPPESAAEGPGCRDPSAASSEASEAVSTPSLQPLAIGAQRAEIDPQTGRLLVPRRPTLEVSRQRLDSFRVPHGAFRQQPLADGGWKLGLQGRMLTPVFATVDPDGRPATTHAWEPIGEEPGASSGASR